MRVLLVHNYYQQRGGEDFVFEAEAQLLRENGHQVETLVFENTQIQNAVDKVKAAVGTLYNFDSARIAERAIKEMKPDIIHVHNFFPLISPAIFFLAHQYHIPMVMTVHNFRLICPGALLLRENAICENCVNQIFPWDSIRYGCYRDSVLATIPIALMLGTHKLINTWQSKVDTYITLLDFAKQKLLNSSLRLNPHQVVIKPNFVFDNGFSFDKSSDYLLYVGRLSQEKGIDTLLTAFESLPYRVKIVGKGPLVDKVMDYANRYPNIEYLGFQNAEAVREIMKGAKALIFPSIWYENFPLTIIEALSTATPVLASNIGGLGDIIQPEVNGLLFEPGNAQDLSAKVKVLLEDDELHRRLLYNARQTYLDHYTPETNYRQLIDVYHDTINRKSAEQA